MSYAYDPISGRTGLNQYLTYLQNESYLRGLRYNTTDLVNYQLVEVRNAISNTSASIQNNIEIATSKVCGTLERGFSELTGQLGDINWRLNEVNENLSNLNSMLDWKTDLIIEQQRITNSYLGRITELLKIPESQKQRTYHVEKGLTYFKGATTEGLNSSYYKDAFIEFDSAVKLERGDYFSLHRIGLIYLYSKSYLDIKKAKSNFLLSAKYSSVQEKYFETSESFLQASRCSYILCDFDEGYKLAKEGLGHSPKNPELLFQATKCLLASDQVQSSLALVSEIIQMNYRYSIKMISDLDFIAKPEVQNLLGRIYREKYDKVVELIGNIEKSKIPSSKAGVYFNGIKQENNKKNLVASFNAYHLLHSVHEWKYTNHTHLVVAPNSYNRVEDEKYDSHTHQQTEYTFKGNVQDFIKLERTQEYERVKIEALVTQKTKERKEKIASDKIRSSLTYIGIAIAIICAIGFIGMALGFHFWSSIVFVFICLVVLVIYGLSQD